MGLWRAFFPLLFKREAVKELVHIVAPSLDIRATPVAVPQPFPDHFPFHTSCYFSHQHFVEDHRV